MVIVLSTAWVNEEDNPTTGTISVLEICALSKTAKHKLNVKRITFFMGIKVRLVFFFIKTCQRQDYLQYSEKSQGNQFLYPLSHSESLSYWFWIIKGMNIQTKKHVFNWLFFSNILFLNEVVVLLHFMCFFFDVWFVGIQKNQILC